MILQNIGRSERFASDKAVSIFKNIEISKYRESQINSILNDDCVDVDNPNLLQTKSDWKKFRIWRILNLNSEFGITG